MDTKHKHYDLMVAWATGEAIQCLYPDNKEWEDVFHTHDWLAENQYRIKPKYPTTLMDEHCMQEALGISYLPDMTNCIKIANAAIRHAIDSGQVIIAHKGE